MKNILAAAFMLLTIALSAQKHTFGITAGVNLPWFYNGDKNFSGIERTSAGLVAGINDKIMFNKHLGIQPSLQYISAGAKNPEENNWVFRTHYISLPVTFLYQAGSINIQAGGYFSKLIMARNWDFSGKVYRWPVRKWNYYQSIDYGLVFGTGVNLQGASIEGHYRVGLDNVRRDFLNDEKMMGSRNMSADISLLIPINEN